MKLAINSVTNNGLCVQVKKPSNVRIVKKLNYKDLAKAVLERVKEQAPTTSQKVLWELMEELMVPLCVIIIHANVTEEEINDINNGKENLEVYAKLICFWALLKTKKEQYESLESKIKEKYMEHVFFPDCHNSNVIASYADKHGA